MFMWQWIGAHLSCGGQEKYYVDHLFRGGQLLLHAPYERINLSGRMVR